MLKARLACTSSSGKYLRCLGTLCGHCGSAATEVAHSAIMAGGRASKCGRCMVDGRNYAGEGKSIGGNIS